MKIPPALFALLFLLPLQLPAEDSASSALERKLDAQSEEIRKLTIEVNRLTRAVDALQGHAPKAVPVHSAPSLEATPAPAPTADPADGKLHHVVKGETLTSIAKLHEISLGDLMKINGIEDGRRLQIGQVLKIPSPQPSPTPKPSPAKP